MTLLTTTTSHSDNLEETIKNLILKKAEGLENLAILGFKKYPRTLFPTQQKDYYFIHFFLTDANRQFLYKKSDDTLDQEKRLDYLFWKQLQKENESAYFFVSASNINYNPEICEKFFCEGMFDSLMPSSTIDILFSGIGISNPIYTAEDYENFDKADLISFQNFIKILNLSPSLWKLIDLDISYLALCKALDMTAFYETESFFNDFRMSLYLKDLQTLYSDLSKESQIKDIEGVFGAIIEYIFSTYDSKIIPFKRRQSRV